MPCTSLAYLLDGSTNSLGTSKSDLRAGRVGLAKSTIDVSSLRSSDGVNSGLCHTALGM